MILVLRWNELHIFLGVFKLNYKASQSACNMNQVKAKVILQRLLIFHFIQIGKVIDPSFPLPTVGK